MPELDDAAGVRFPPQYERIVARSQQIGFGMNSEVPTGSLLRALAASKPTGSFLELGTGCGPSTCWLLDGMDQASSLISIDTDARAQEIARSELEGDHRLTLVPNRHA